ncbi:DEAD/DEAH box helicase [Chloroflexota bacterium]
MSNKYTWVNGTRIYFSYPFDRTINERIKEIPGRKFDGESKLWSVPKAQALEVIDKFPDFEMPDELGALIAAADERFDRLEAAREASVNPTPLFVPGLDDVLLHYQKCGVNFLQESGGRCIVGDEMGLGKSLQVIAWLKLNPDIRPALIVCPASLKLNWQHEFEKWLPGEERIQVLNGKRVQYKTRQKNKVKYKEKIIQEVDPDTTIAIINYDTLDDWKEYLDTIGFQVMICDEVHFLQSHTAKRTKAVEHLAMGISRFVGLTGTPIKNRPINFWPILTILDGAEWGNRMEYGKKYCNAHQTPIPCKKDAKGKKYTVNDLYQMYAKGDLSQRAYEAARKHGAYYFKLRWDFNGASNLGELYRRTRPYVIRRTKKTELKDLPPKRRTALSFPMPGKFIAEYMDEIVKVRERIAKAKAEGRSSSGEHLGLIEGLKQIAARAKLEAFEEWAQTVLDAEEKLIIFVVHKSIARHLKAVYGDAAVVITGETPQKQRDEAVQRFQNDDSVRVFIGNIQAAGVGLTLTAASNVAVFEFPWSPVDALQSEDRSHRLGQEEMVNCWYIVAQNTIDQKIVDTLDRKMRIISKAVDNRFDTSFNILDEVVDEVMQIQL